MAGKKRQKWPGGRPALSDTEPSEVVGFKLPVSVKAAFLAHCKKKGYRHHSARLQLLVKRDLAEG